MCALRACLLPCVSSRSPPAVRPRAECYGQAEFATLGLHNRTVEDVAEFDHVEHIPIKNGTVHPCYNSANLDYDVALLELEWSTQLYADRVVALDDPAASSLPGPEPLTVMGMGTLFYYPFIPPLSNALQAVEVTQDLECGDYDPAEITGSMFCAGSGGKGTCQVSGALVRGEEIEKGGALCLEGRRALRSFDRSPTHRTSPACVATSSSGRHWRSHHCHRFRDPTTEAGGPPVL